jgi:tRNA A-37 threonylcarbamoyl transferase component Bud32
MDGDAAVGRQSAGTLRIGRYRVEAVLGTGAFATVYQAVDERLDDTVAVKVLAENHSLDPEIRSRFLTEGRVLRRIASPHVVSVHDLGETERQQPFLVLEHADRGTLRQRVSELAGRGWRAGAADVWAVADPLAQALAAVHRAGVVHRDLNPANVLVTTRGRHAAGPATAVTGWGERLVLADLGLCKDLALNSGHTSAGGTEGFRPPELRRGPAVIDGRADLWSLSAVIVWLITGAPPGDVPAERALAATGLPAGLACALDRSLAADPAVRHPDPHAWLAEVAAALGMQPGAGSPAAPPSPPPPPPPPPADALGPFLPTAMAGVAPPGVYPPAPGPMAGPAVGPSPSIGPTAVAGRSATTPVPGSGGRDGTPVDAGPPPAARSWGWRLWHSGWVLSAFGLGLTTWIGFMYVGLRADRRPWRLAAAAYGVAATAIVALAIAAPTGPDGEVDDGAWQSIAGMTLLGLTFVGGCVHAVVANRAWLRWLSRASVT